MKFRALYWWIDRWRKSTAYTDMTLAEQGAYRNLLDEATLRGGALPDDDRVLAKACGDAMEWPAIRHTVMRRFFKLDDGWHNETLDQVLDATLTRAARQARYRQGTMSPVVSDLDERKARDRARQATSRAMKAGQLQRQPCEECGDPNSQAHHDDYGKPLEVRWLCPQHHDKFHRRSVRVTDKESSAQQPAFSGSGSGSGSGSRDPDE
jgi:uncharacterized protein YdaU (DUF1376 family)